MKSILSVLVISLLITLFVGSVSAQITKPQPTGSTAPIQKEIIQNETIQNKLEATKGIIATKEAALKQKLASFVDKQKASKIQKVTLTLNQINTKWVEQANEFLTNATRILDRLQERVNQKGADGQDTTQANAAIDSAREKIASASAAVLVQSGMDYTVNVSTEAAAKVESKLMRDKLDSDWRTVRQLLRESKKAVAEAINIAATTLGGIGGGTKK